MSYSTWSKDHKHIQPRPVHIPASGRLTIPYRWMLKESGFEIAKDLELDADPEREPDSPNWLARTSWIQGFANQEALLDAFGEVVDGGQRRALRFPIRRRRYPEACSQRWSPSFVMQCS